MPNKDRLSYLQVCYETNLNKKAEIKFNKHSKSRTAICSLAIFSLAVVVCVGVFICFFKTILSVTLGLAMILSVFIIDFFMIKRIKITFLKENENYKNKIQLVENETKKILVKVNSFIENKVKLENGRSQYAKE